MRKVAFVKIPDNIQKLMIYDSPEGVFLFGYDCLQDTSAIWDSWYTVITDAEEFCSDTYQIDKDDWIVISDPCPECQHDFIAQIRIKGRNINNPQFGQLQKFEKGAWVDTLKFDKQQSFDGLTGNERLYVSGLITEFDNAKKNDKGKAIKILSALRFDKESINKIV
jgi:biofilm protein TabA